MDPLIIRIANIIDPVRLNNPDSGLFNGSMGLSLFYYHLSRFTGNSNYEKAAEELTDMVFSNLNILTPVDFEKGLAGIGWAIEYLVQNKFADGDTDEILDEADNKIFRLLNEETINSFELTNGLTGYLVYLLFRIQNPAQDNSVAKQFNRELLILCINRLYEIVTPHFPLLVKDFIFDLFWSFPLMLYALTRVFQFDIYNHKIICMIRQWIPNFEAYIPSMNVNRIYFATILKRINELIPDRRLGKQIKLLLFCTDFKELINEIDTDVKSVRFGLPGLMIILDKAVRSFNTDFPNYSELSNTHKFLKNELGKLFGSVNMEDFKSEQTKYGLSEGIAGLGLVSILIPQLYQ